jgi:hypothetical protein
VQITHGETGQKTLKIDEGIGSHSQKNKTGKKTMKIYHGEIFQFMWWLTQALCKQYEKFTSIAF